MGVKEQMQAIVKAHGASRDGLGQGAKVLAEAVAQGLKVKSDEVAIMLLNTSGQTLVFVWPPPLFDSHAAFPAAHKTAIASSILTTMKGKVDNKMAESKHLKFYELVKGMETSKLPIQKMVALPSSWETGNSGWWRFPARGRPPMRRAPISLPRTPRPSWPFARRPPPSSASSCPTRSCEPLPRLRVGRGSRAMPETLDPRAFRDPAAWLSGQPVTLPIAGISMVPFLLDGDRVDVVGARPSDMAAGDLLVFLRGEEVVVHRFPRGAKGPLPGKGRRPEQG